MKVASLLNGYKIKDAQARAELKELKEYVDEKFLDVFSQMLPREKMYWLEGSEQAESNYQGLVQVDINAPAGVNLNDCIVLGAMAKGFSGSSWATVSRSHISEAGLTTAYQTLNPTISFLESTSQLRITGNIERGNAGIQFSYRILLFDRTVG